MTIKTTTLLFLILTVPLLLSVVLGFKSFFIWSQILDPWSRGETPSNLIAELNPHALRYALVYPILILSDISGIDHDVIFSGIVVVFLYQTGKYIFKTVVIVNSTLAGSTFAIIVIYSVITTLFLLMNGRVSFAFLGYAMLLYSVVQIIYSGAFRLSGLPLALLATLMCSVSSGILVSALATLTIAFIIEIKTTVSTRKINWPKLYFFVVFIAVTASFYGFTMIGIRKNLLFFGGGYQGFIAMLKHGFGQTFIPLLSIFNIYSLAATAIAAITIGVYILQKMEASFLLATILITVTGGAFGMSTLSISIIPILVYLLQKLPGKRAIHRQEQRSEI